MTSRRLPLSAVLITLNAASQLRPTLESVAFCDEIIVVDSGSTDGTQALAREYGAKVIEAGWLGFGPMKQFAVIQARNDWVLCVDSDERVSERLRSSVFQVLSAVPPAPTFDAYQFPRCNRFMGRYLKHGEGYPDWSLRLFDRRQARWSDDAVHEHVLTDAAVGRLAGDLLHDTAETLDTYLTKQNRYTTLAANSAFAAGKRVNSAHLLISPLIRFLKFYVVRRGFLDGIPGLVHILIGCQNSFAKYAKILALQGKQSS